MSDYLLKIAVKNNRLVRRMRACGFESGSALARAANVSVKHVSDLMTLRTASRRADGEWRQRVMDIATALRCEPEDICPVQHWDRALKMREVEIEANAEDIGVLASSLRGSRPSDALELQAAENTVQALLGLLPLRERDVVERRLGFNGEEETYREIGKTMGVTTERVRQIEAKAIRRLRENVGARRRYGALDALETLDELTH